MQNFSFVLFLCRWDFNFNLLWRLITLGGLHQSRNTELLLGVVLGGVSSWFRLELIFVSCDDGGGILVVCSDLRVGKSH